MITNYGLLNIYLLIWLVEFSIILILLYLELTCDLEKEKRRIH